MGLDIAKEHVLFACRAMIERNLTYGTGGNISEKVKNEDMFVITPSGIDYMKIKEDDLVVVDFDGKIVEGFRKPSVEISMHRFILKNRPDISAVVHTHSFYATTFASSKNAKKLPVFNCEGLYSLRGEVDVVDFAPPGSQELANLASGGIEDKNAVILKNHGAIGVGKSMEKALAVSQVIERCCKAFLLSGLSGGIQELPNEYVESITNKIV